MASMEREGKRNRLGNSQQRAMYKGFKGKTRVIGEPHTGNSQYQALCKKADGLHGISRKSQTEE